MMDAPSGARPRRTYHHGDLRRALLDAGIALARDGGPDAVVLREATRRAGVVPNAAYRHFASRDALLQAVRAAALSALAVAMEKELARLRRGWRRDPRVPACARSAPPTCASRAPNRACSARPSPSRAIPRRPAVRRWQARAASIRSSCWASALDRMVEAGVLPAERRPGAEYLAWSAVHGLAMLVLEGPLRRLPRTQMRVIEQRLLDMVDKGL